MDEVNVKVAVRVRPILQREKLASEQSCVRIIPANNQVILGKDRAFTFDHVLGPKSTQEELYENCFKPLVTSCFEGYNCTVFAYGQTGSGKTYTIGGGNIAALTEDEFGILPRAIKNIFGHIEEHKQIDYKVKVSYIEVYKEELADLLDIETSSKDLHIREDETGNTMIIGARDVECECLEEVMSCLESGSSVRHTGSTQMNEQSSRSHSIFTMLIEQSWCDQEIPVRDQTNEEEDQDGDMTHYMCGKFHFVDLAGSERAHKTGNVGDRFKESVHINTGLLALGNVISALGDPKKKSTHIPYRDAKITRILKDSLGGNAKTLMICCISPSSGSFDESLNSLKYANRAKNIKNKPIVNRDPQSIRFEEMQSEIRALREELSRQRTSLFTAEGGDSVSSAQAIRDASHIRTLDEQISRLQTECSQYHMIAEDAYKQLIDIQQREILSSSQNIRLRDWLDLMEEIKNKVPVTLNKDAWDNQNINRLKHELRKCQEDLKSDEKIFAEKNIEINVLKERLIDLEQVHEKNSSNAEDLLVKTRKQEQQLVEQQLKIEEMEKRLKEQDRLLSVGSSHDSQLPIGDELLPLSARRAKSVPANMIKRQSSSDNVDHLHTRQIHTSPALISLDRVMQGFRARSQLLANQLDDEDEVRQVLFEEGAGNEEDGIKPFVRQNTYKIKKKRSQSKLAGTDGTKSGVSQQGSIPVSTSSTRSKARKESHQTDDSVFVSQTDDGDVEKLQENTLLQKRKIKECQLKLQNANQKMRDLSINIRLKEQLIRDLVKSSKEADTLNKRYADKIKSLEKERSVAKSEVAETQKALQELEAKEQQETNEKKRLQQEFHKKIESSKARMRTLQRKQVETEKMANITGQNEKRIQDLEVAIDRMKQQQNNLNKKLKEELENKDKLEKEMFRDQHKIKELEMRNEQQSKVLKIKTEETAALHRRLRSGGSSSSSQRRWLALHQDKTKRGEQEKVEEQKRWLDGEIEKVIEQRRKMEELQEELKKREEIIAKKEGMLTEKSELEIKKLRSSQHVNKDMLSVATKLEAVERKLQEKNREMATTPQEERAALEEEVKNLQNGREALLKQRVKLDEKLHGGNILSTEEERRLIELDEAIEALEAAMEYKNDAIQNRQEEIRRSHLSLMDDNHLLAKLNTLSGNDSKALLTKYFEKVISLREQERSTELQKSELETQVDEQNRLIKELELSLDRAGAEVDRKLTQQQQAYEKKIQLLMRQLAEVNQSGDPDAITRIQQLEKDLFYYKKTSRDLKKKIKELMVKGGFLQEGEETDASVHSLSTPRDYGEGGYKGSSRPSSVRENREPTPRSSRTVSKKSDANGERVVTPVKISRKELRQMTEEEVSMRKSNASQISLADSLEVKNENPWS